jgi:hypothetical protein
MQPGTQPDDKTALGDLGRSVKTGIEQLPGMATGLADLVPAVVANVRPFNAAAEWGAEKTGFAPGKWAKETKFSAGYNASQADVGAAWKAADIDPAASLTDQFTSLLKATPDLAKAYASNPMYTLNQVANSAPSMVAGGAISKGLMGVGGVAARAVSAEAGGIGAAAPAVAGLAERTLGSWAAPVTAGAGEGIVQAGQAMDGADDPQHPAIDARHAAIGAIGSGTIDMLVGVGAGKFANAMGLETMGTKMAGGKRAGLSTEPITWGQRAAFMAKGGVSEGLLQEVPQSAQEQVWQNYSTGQPLMTDVFKQGIEGGLSGAVMGAGANMTGGREHVAPAPAATPAAPPATGPTSILPGATPAPAAPAADSSSGVLSVASILTTDPNDVAGQLSEIPTEDAAGLMQGVAAADPAHHEEIVKAMAARQQATEASQQAQQQQQAAQAEQQAQQAEAAKQQAMADVEHTLRRYGEHEPVDPNAPDAHHTFDGQVHNTLPLAEQAIVARVAEDAKRVAEQAKATGVPAQVIQEAEGAFGAAFRTTEAAKELGATAEKPYEAKTVKFTHDILTGVLAGAQTIADVSRNIAVHLKAATGNKKADFETRALLQRMQNVLATPLGEDHAATIDNNVGPLAPPPKAAKADAGAAPASAGTTSTPAAAPVAPAATPAAKKGKQSAPAPAATEGAVVKTKTQIGHENTIEKFKMLLDCLKGK